MAESPRIGVTVLADYLINEGVEPVLDNLVERCGCTAVATNPTATAPAKEGQGLWQPPDDAGTSVRLFDRPLWGRQALWIRGAASYYPNPDHYTDSPYLPRKANELTDRHGSVIGEFVQAAKARGLLVYFQVGATQPPRLRDEDRPRLPDGRLPENPMAGIGSLASDAIRAYNRAYAKDLVEHYPQIDGVRIDWPEYPCYKLDEAFCDFSPAVERFASARGYDFASLKQGIDRGHQLLHGALSDEMLEMLASRVGEPEALLLAGVDPSLAAAWLQLKSDLSADVIADWADAMGPHHAVSANAFPPGYSRLTGLHCERALTHAESVSPKLYTMHWSLMVEFWGRRLMNANPGLDETLLVKALCAGMDIGYEGRTLADYGYPEPDQRHPIPDAAQIRKLEQAVAEAAGRGPVHALVHGYGPPDDFRRRLALVPRSGADGFWVNRYGYLSDEKLDIIGEVARGWGG